jgi:hypothetical protein
MPWHQKRVLERARVQRQSVLRDRKSRIRRERQFRSVPSVRSIARPAHLLSLKRAARKQAPWRCAAAWSQRRPSSIGAYVDTGFACSPARDPQTLVVTAPPSGTISVGGYCFRQSQIEAAVVQAGPKATIVVLPDAELGQRLAGTAADREALQSGSQARGANPLLSGPSNRGTAQSCLISFAVDQALTAYEIIYLI